LVQEKLAAEAKRLEDEGIAATEKAAEEKRLQLEQAAAEERLSEGQRVAAQKKSWKKKNLRLKLSS
jgi:hypothetical protein